MRSTLVQRYTYGNFSDPPILGPQADFFLGMPARQQELVSLARAQIDAQNRATKALVQSNIAGAEMIRKELQLQTEQLTSAIEKGADTVVAALDHLGDRIAGELTEIRWELVQLRMISGQILEVLKRPRSTEAQELLQQGVRNLVNDKIEQAEERFMLALKRDNTDYQVLMNLSVVALRKASVESAIAYVHDALTLPQTLDATARADALWHLARIQYALEQYGEALSVGKQSVALISTPRRILQVGVYSILAGRLQEGLKLIADAVRSEASLFAVAASSPDLLPHRTQVDSMLGTLAAQSLAELRSLLMKCRAESSAVNHLEAIGAARIERYQVVLRSFNLLLDSEPSYSECRSAISQVPTLQELASKLRLLNDTELKLRDYTRDKDMAAQQLELTKGELKRLPNSPGCLAAVIGFMGQMALMILVNSLQIHVPDARTTAGTLLLVFGGLGPFWIGIPIYLFLTSAARRRTAASKSAERNITQVKEQIQLTQREQSEIEASTARLFATIELRQ